MRATSSRQKNAACGVHGARNTTVLVPDAPEAAPPCSSAPPLTQQHSKIDATEEYGNDERMLNEFVKLHPMLSLENKSVETLQIIAEIMHKAHIPVRDVETVPKSHDDLFLRPPETAIGERACACGSRCLCTFIAKVRYGVNTNMAFVNREFLLPTQLRAFMNGEGLPAHRQKCLVCTRYYMNYVYIMVSCLYKAFCVTQLAQTSKLQAFVSHATPFDARACNLLRLVQIPSSRFRTACPCSASRTQYLSSFQCTKT